MSMKNASQLKEEEEKEKKQQRERQRQCKLKLLLETYTQQKKEQEEFLRLEKEIREKTEKAEKRKTAADEISRFQERVSKYISWIIFQWYTWRYYFQVQFGKN